MVDTLRGAPPGLGARGQEQGNQDKARKQRDWNGILPCLELGNCPLTSWWAADHSVGGKGAGASPVDFVPSFVQ